MTTSNIKHDPILDIANNFVKTKFEDITQKAIDSAKIEVLDSIGVALAGSAKPGIQELIGVLKGLGGEKQSSVIASTVKLPVIHAAQINASMIHALDFDDTIDLAGMHPGCIVIPSSLAVAEYKGNISGKELITAIVLGSDFITRMGLATQYETNLYQAGWHLTPLYGFMAAAGVAGKLMDFTEEKMVHAFGIAYHQASGNLQGSTDGALTKRMGPGFAVRGGIMSALMADAGITGARNCIEGRYGIFKVYHHDAYNRETLLQNLGKEFAGINLTVKPYPCCRQTHPFIEAALGLVRENDIAPDEIKEIKIFAGDGGLRLCTPLEVKANPKTPIDSQFSVPWTVAAAIRNRKVSIKDFTEEAIKDDNILSLTRKIQVEYDAELNRSALDPGRVKIVTRNGTYIKQIDIPSGGPDNPMSFDDIVSKFCECSQYSIKPMKKETLDRVITLVARLEELQDATEIMKLLE